jgi:uncharacterized protein (DUF2141 family)
MSNVKSLSKSRWKGALLATVAASVFAPLAANAQTAPSMTLSLSLSPLGDTNAYGGKGFVDDTVPGNVGGYAQGPSTTEYIPPDQSTPIYVYATVTGSSAVSASYIDGLQYVYFNVLESSNVNVAEGTITKAVPNAALGFAFAANGSQNGSTGYTSGNLAVGSTSVLTSVAKPRSVRPVWSSSVAGTGDGSNVIIQGNSVSFLVETLYYTPSTHTYVNGSQTSGDSSYTANGGVTNSFTLAPESSLSSLLTTGGYAATNYFVGETAGTPGFNTGAGASYTYTNYNVSSSGVNLIDAEAGDINLDGKVDANDFGLFGPNYGTVTSGWTNGDFNGDGKVDANDFGLLGPNYGIGLSGPNPSGGISGLIGGGSPVPEPTSLGFLAVSGVAFIARRRRAVR